MEELKVFQNAEFGQIRTVTINNETYFVGKDVAIALGYAEPRSTISKKIDAEDRGVAKLETPSGIQEMTIINESGLYSLILGSKLESAKRFKHWVTSEILPTIRKTGGYVNDDELFINTYLPFADETTKMLFGTTLETVRKQNEIIKNQQLAIAQKEQIIQEMQPKVSYYDLVLQAENLVAISKIAKDYGMSATQLNHLLNELGVQYKMSGTWLLYQKYASQGYTQSKTHVVKEDYSVMHTYWTQKGRLFIYDLLKNQKGILPLIERE